MAVPSSAVVELASRGASQTPSFEIRLALVNLIFLESMLSSFFCLHH
jgi:hypothetical protein